MGKTFYTFLLFIFLQVFCANAYLGLSLDEIKDKHGDPKKIIDEEFGVYFEHWVFFDVGKNMEALFKFDRNETCMSLSLSQRNKDNNRVGFGVDQNEIVLDLFKSYQQNLKDNKWIMLHDGVAIKIWHGILKRNEEMVIAVYRENHFSIYFNNFHEQQRRDRDRYIREKNTR